MDTGTADAGNMNPADADAGEETDASDADIVDSGLPDAADAGDSAAADAGVADANAADAIEYDGPLVPCTTGGQTGCVPCSFNVNGACTPTEALFLQRDIEAGLATLDRGTDAGCYYCLSCSACLADTVYGDTNHECGDLPGVFDAGAQAGTLRSELCLDTMQCVLATSCAVQAIGVCYCGPITESACVAAGSAVAGPCQVQEAAGLGFPVGDSVDIANNYTRGSLPSGLANEIFNCALNNGCTACVQ